MSLIVVGLSHHTTPVPVLELVALDPDRRRALDAALRAGDHVAEWLVMSTCNRIEIYAEVATFHGGVAEIGEALAATTNLTVDALRQHLYVHYDERAVAHLFDVASGLDSMAVGESQILAQLRDALTAARESRSIGSSLEDLVQQALRVGKRVHTETQIDTVSRSLVQQALAEAADVLGDLGARRGLVVGAGAMSGLAAHTLARAGIGELTVINRTPARAQRLAAATGGRAADWARLPDAVAAADVVVSCTGAVGYVLDAELVGAALAGSGASVLIDLALPRDVDPVLADLPGVRLISLESLSQTGLDDGVGRQVRVAQELVTAEVAEFVVRRRAAAVGPTVAALRARVAQVVDAELDRLDGRVHLAEREDAEVRRAVHRIVEKLLHSPTVRMKQLAMQDEGHDYAALVQTLFDLDPHTTRVAEIPPEVRS